MEQEQKTFQYSYDDQPQPTSNSIVKEEALPEEAIEHINCNFQIPSDLEKVKYAIRMVDMIESTLTVWHIAQDAKAS